MTQFLLEIYGEDIPPLFQKEGEEKIKSAFENFFYQQKIDFTKIDTFSTSRRFVVVVYGLPINKPSDKELIRGPLTSANKLAIQGFLKSRKILKESELKKKIIKNKEYFFYENIIPKTSLKDILRKEILKILFNIKWSKSMVWLQKDLKWIRPINHVFCIFNKQNILFDDNNIKSINYFYGNYQYNNKKLKCLSFKDYENKLEKNFVILRSEKRIEKIEKYLSKFRKQNNKIIYDKKTIDLVEFPNLFFGNFDKTFLKLPESFLIAVISGKQNYFAFKNNKNTLENFFAYISNRSEDKNIQKDFEKVLHSRFLDTIYFLESDKKIGLKKYYNKLEYLIYFKGLGNLKQKSERIFSLCKFIAKKLYANKLFKDNGDFVYEEVKFAKADLVSNLVQEFPELQGHVGAHLFELEGANNSLCMAIKQQYCPISLNDKCPQNPLSISLSIADKIDHLVGIFLIGKKPTGSKDPYALRRAAFGLLRIIIENKLSIDLSDLLSKSADIFFIQKEKSKKRIKKNNFDSFNFEKFEKENIIRFLNQRLEYFLKNDFPKNLINSVNENKNYYDPYLIFKKIDTLKAFLSKKESQEFLKAYKRMNSILGKSSKDMKIDIKLFEKPEEKLLYNAITDLEKRINKNEINNKKFNFSQDLIFLLNLTLPINNFFDNVQVNSCNDILKKNRVSILYRCNKVLQELCNFSSIIN